MSPNRPLTPIVLLLSPQDAMTITATLGQPHNPTRGRIVVCPTVGVSEAGVLANDILAALGHPPRQLTREQLPGAAAAWQAATAWCLADDVTEVVVLHAHLLLAQRWAHLVDMWRATGVRLVLVCRPGTTRKEISARLGDLPHRVTTEVGEALPVLPDRPAIPEPTEQLEPLQSLPLLPDSDVTRFRAHAWRWLPTEEFARVDAMYTTGRERALIWLAERPEAIGPDTTASGAQHPASWDNHLALQKFLSALVCDSPSRRHTVTLVRGAQAAFLLRGLLLKIPSDLGSLGGPGLTNTLFTSQVASRIRSGVASPIRAAALATVLLTGLDPAGLAKTAVSHLSDDASSLCLHPHKASAASAEAAMAFHVPDQARPLLTAARSFLHLRGANSVDWMSDPGNGANLSEVKASADACGLVLPFEPWPLRLSWHTTTRCWWVSQSLESVVDAVPVDRTRPRRSPAVRARDAADLMSLVRNGEVGAPEATLLEEVGLIRGMEPHPDVLFALGLASRPGSGDGPAGTSHKISIL